MKRINWFCLTGMMAIWFLPVLMAEQPGGESSPVYRIIRTPLTMEEEILAAEDPASIIKRFVDPLTLPRKAREGAFLDSDQEHAESMGPVLIDQIPVYLHYYENVGALLRDKNFLLVNGRIFMNYDLPFERDKAPALKLRPVDGGQRISFLARVFIYPKSDPVDNGSIEMSLRFPAIFNPLVTIRNVSSNGKKMTHRLASGPTPDQFTLTIPVSRKDLEELEENGEGNLIFYIEGEVELQPYEVLSPGRFDDSSAALSDPSLSGIAKILPGRDFGAEEERARIQGLADQLSAGVKNRYELVVRTHRYVSGNLRYFRNSMKRTTMQVMDEGLADCDDFSRVMVALLRAMGIPCKPVVGYLYDFNNMGAHAWVEVALPESNGRIRWFICDPTLASVSEDKDRFVQFNNRIYIYPVRLMINPINLPVDHVSDILLNWFTGKPQEIPSFQVFPGIVNNFADDLENSLVNCINTIKTAGLVMPREFLFEPGSSYILLDRPPVADSSKLSEMREPDHVIKLDKAPPAHSRFQVKLNSQEQLVLELGVTDEDFDLSAPEDQRTMQLMQLVFKDLRNLFFQGQDIRHCLELIYYRDRYTDRLQKMTVKINRYLVENHFKKIIDTLRKHGFTSEGDYSRLDRLYTESKGKNLYFIQEMIRREVPPAARAVPRTIGHGADLEDPPDFR